MKENIGSSVHCHQEHVWVLTNYLKFCFHQFMALQPGTQVMTQLEKPERERVERRGYEKKKMETGMRQHFSRCGKCSDTHTIETYKSEGPLTSL